MSLKQGKSVPEAEDANKAIMLRTVEARMLNCRVEADGLGSVDV